MSTTKTKIPLNNINMLSKEDFDNVNFEEHPNELFYTLDETDVIYSDVDAQLSDISENPVQNKVITKALNDKVSNEDISLDANTFAESERQKSKNLFDASAVIKNKSLDGNRGIIVDTSDWWISNYMYVKGLSYVTISTSKTQGGTNFFYDENYNLITYLNHRVNGVLEIPDNAVYMLINGVISELGNNIQVESGTVATDYQPYNGTIIHEKQLKETAEKMGRLYQNNNTAIQIQNSSLTTLSDYFNLFNLDKTKVYNCYKAFNQTTNFTDLLNLPSTIANEALFVLISLDVNGEAGENNYYSVYKITIFNSSHSNCHIGYMGKGYDNVVRVIGWTKIGG